MISPNWQLFPFCVQCETCLEAIQFSINSCSISTVIFCKSARLSFVSDCVSAISNECRLSRFWTFWS